MTIKELISAIAEIKKLQEKKAANENLPKWESDWTTTDEFVLNRLLETELKEVTYDED